MYMNTCQKYIGELLDEYGPLLQRQLLVMINAHFQTELTDLAGYINQMCQFGAYEKELISNEVLLSPQGAVPDFDMIRCFDVMLKFIKNTIWHRKSREYVKLRFFVSTERHDKEISVIPVKQGMERTISRYVEDRFGNAKCEVVIFLLSDKEQIKNIRVDCNYKFAVFDKNGVQFFKGN